MIEQVALACDEAWQRLLEPALAREALTAAKQRADAEAIAVFQSNLRELLLSAPLGRKRVLAIDPGLRTGCNRRAIRLRDYVTDELGEPTLRDILDELARPGRDPRATFAAFAFADVHSLADLETGMVLPGIVTNVTAFGAFVDLGVHQDGLIHISQLADRFVKDPHEVVTVRQQLTVRVLEVDTARKRIALTPRDV